MLYFRLITGRGVKDSDAERQLTVPVPGSFTVSPISYPEKLDLDFKDDVPMYRVEIHDLDKPETFYVCTRDYAFIMNEDFKTIQTVHKPGPYSAEIREKYSVKKRK